VLCDILLAYLGCSTHQHMVLFTRRTMHATFGLMLRQHFEGSPAASGWIWGRAEAVRRCTRRGWLFINDEAYIPLKVNLVVFCNTLDGMEVACPSLLSCMCFQTCAQDRRPAAAL
jgi:hypothetical protein